MAIALAALIPLLLSGAGSAVQIFMELPRWMQYIVVVAILLGFSWKFEVPLVGGTFSFGEFLFSPVTSSLCWLNVCGVTFQAFAALVIVTMLVLFVLTLNAGAGNR